MAASLSLDHLPTLAPMANWGNSSIAVIISLTMCFIAYKILSQSTVFNTQVKHWLTLLIRSAKLPLFIFLLFYLANFALDLIATSFPSVANNRLVSFATVITPYLFKLVCFVTPLWFVWRAINAVQKSLQQQTLYKDGPMFRIMLPIINNSLRAAIIFMTVNLLLPELGLTGISQIALEKMARLILIGILGWLFYQIVNAAEKIILYQFSSSATVNIEGRKIKTNVLILKRILLAIGLVVTIAACLFVFDSVRQLGAGLLTTAGIVSAAGALASKESISRVFAGLQIAFSQPIRIGDVVIINNETGEVEEISLSFVVVKLWDLRRLIIPTDTIMQNGFQNLTRNSTQLLGTIFFYVDYTLPVEPVRQKFLEIVQQSVFWDHKISMLQVTEMQDTVMQLRGLVSAADGDKLGELRCEVREKLIAYIVQRFPECLPKTRQIKANNEHALT